MEKSYFHIIVIREFKDKPYRQLEKIFKIGEKFIICNNQDIGNYYEYCNYRIPKEYVSVMLCKSEKPKHFCSIEMYPGLKIIYNKQGIFPVTQCWQENNELWVANHGKHSAMQVNFCIFCGYSPTIKNQIN